MYKMVNTVALGSNTDANATSNLEWDCIQTSQGAYWVDCSPFRHWSLAELLQERTSAYRSWHWMESQTYSPGLCHTITTITTTTTTTILLLYC